MSTVRLLLSLLPILASANPLLARAPKCAADDCARAVTGTSAGAKPAIATRSADCSSFFRVTVTPVTTTTVTSFTSTATVITTSTVSTTVVTTVVGGVPQKRQAADTTTITNVPTAIPAYASACAGSARYSSACACLGITRTTSTAATSTATVVVNTITTVSSTTTTTTTIISTTTAGSTLPTLCGNAGLSWAFWRDFSNDDYPYYDPTQHKQDTPFNVGVTPNAFLARGSNSLYGYDISYNDDFEGNPTNFAFTQRGYIYAAETGTYTLQSNDIDDFLFVWIGPQAYSGWNRANALLKANVNTPASSNFASINLVAGAYVPFRIYFKQYGGPASLQLTVKSPSGTTIISPTSSNSPLLVQYSCDGQIAPMYPPYGQET